MFALYICSPIKESNFFNEDGAVAQSVEQRTENPCVAGSIPAHTTENQAVTAKVVAAFVFGRTLVEQLIVVYIFAKIP